MEVEEDDDVGEPLQPVEAGRELRVCTVEAPSVRVVFGDEGVEYPQPFAWTPEGTGILASLARTDRTNQIVLISVEDGSTRVLKAAGSRSPCSSRSRRSPRPSAPPTSGSSAASEFVAQG